MRENDIKLLKQLEREMWSQYEHYNDLCDKSDISSCLHAYSRMARHYLEYDVILTVLIDKLERGVLK